MTLTKWQPVGGLFSLHDRINRLFEDAYKKDLPQSAGFDTWYPASDIYETKDDYVFKLEVPGLAKEDVIESIGWAEGVAKEDMVTSKGWAEGYDKKS